MLVRMQKKGNPLTLLVGMQPGAASLKNSMEVPQKILNRTTLQSSNYTARYLSKGHKTTDWKGYMHPDVCSSIFNNSQIMGKKTHKYPSTDEQIKKRLVYTYNGTPLGHKKKNEIFPFVTMWMELECIMLN